jgi:CDP-diacylglycerol--serine O-phosphatidyltransferase
MSASPPNSAESRPRKGLFLVPSLFTTGNMLLGFYGLITGIRGDYPKAALLVFAAAFLDGLDGRFARSGGTESDFGREYDSLADLLTFGMVPALLAWFWGLDELGRIGWLIPFFYVVCTATRLARFNVQTGSTDRRFFVGLPAPAAAGLLGSILFFARPARYRDETLIVLLVALVVLGLLMLSTFRYYSFKELDPRRRWSYRAILPLMAIVLLILLDPGIFFLTVSGSYALSGPLLWLSGRVRNRDRGGTREAEESTS